MTTLCMAIGIGILAVAALRSVAASRAAAPVPVRANGRRRLRRA